MPNQEQHTRCTGQSGRRQPRSTSKSTRGEAGAGGANQKFPRVRTKKSDLPLTWGLLENLEDGVTPTFLDIMSCFSEFVAFYTDCDTDPEEIEEIKKYMSQNKCRFCS